MRFQGLSSFSRLTLIGGILLTLLLLLAPTAKAQKPGSFYWGDSDMDGIISGNDYATVVSVYMDNTQDDADLYFGYPQSRYRQDLDGDGLISGADISFLESWFVGDWNTYGAPTTLEWAGATIGLTVGNAQGNSVEVSAISYSSAGAGHWPRTGFGIIFGIAPTSQCASTVQIYGFDPAGGATVKAWRNPLGYDYQPSLLNPELGIAAVKVRAVGCALGSIIRLTAYIPGDMEYLIPGQRNPVRLSAPATLDIEVKRSCHNVISVDVLPGSTNIEEGATITFQAICTLDDATTVDCTESYCGMATEWSSTGHLVQSDPPQTFEGLMGNGIGEVSAELGSGGTIILDGGSVWIWDITPPETTITSSPPDPSNSMNADFSFICDEASCTFMCQLDNDGWRDCLSPTSYGSLVQGTHTFEVRAVDAAWHIDPTPASYTWSIDYIPPETFISSNPADPSNQADPVFEFDCVGGPCTFECQIDGQGWQPCSSPYGYFGLGEGVHGFEVRATDGLGNTDQSPAFYNWTIDLTPPESNIYSYPPNPSTSTSATFYFNCNESGCTMECRLDLAGWGNCPGSMSYSSLAEGDHLFEVRATDLALNTNPVPESYAWFIDSIPPDTSITSNPPSLTNSSTADFAFECTGGPCTFECQMESAWTPCVSPVQYLGLAEGGRYFYVRAIDGVGNVDPSVAQYYWYIDTTPPETYLGSWPANPTNLTDASFTFWSNDGSTVYECQLDSGGWSLCASPKDYTGLLNGDHVFEVRAIDQAGNADPTPASYSWTIDTDAPDTTITSNPPNPSDSYNNWFTFSCSEPECTFECQIDSSGWYGCSSPHNASIGDGSHTFYVRARDPSGNIDPSPASYTWVVDTAPPDTTILTKPPDPDNQDPATFTFICNEATCTFECQIDSLGWFVCESPKSYPGLVQGAHQFEVRALDAANNVDASPAVYNWTVFLDRWYPTRANAPYNRFMHAAVWTGTEMIIWGGQYTPYPYRTLNTGGRYNPVTDSWIPTAVTGAPGGGKFTTAVWTDSAMIVFAGGSSMGIYRPEIDSWVGGRMAGYSVEWKDEGFTTVWTGTEMIVWGGVSSNNYYNTGARYNPSTDRWSATSTVDAPSPREYHAAVWAGTEMIIWGGWDGMSYFNDGGKYDPATNSWTATTLTNAPETRGFHTAVWTDAEMIVWGGYDGNFYLNDGGKYNPGSDSWTPVSTTGAPWPRYLHTGVWTGAEMIVWGGYDGEYYFKDGGRYNPSSDSWAATSTAGAPSERSYHSAVWADTEMFIWGGYNWDGSTEYCFNDGGRYDPVADSWIPIATVSAPSIRADHTAIWTGSEMIVWGGYYYDGTDRYLDTGGRYDPVTDSWVETSLVNVPLARRYHTAVWTGNEMIVWGGHNGGYLNTGGKYDPSIDSWTSTSLVDAPSQRSYHTAVWTTTEMIIWGGDNGSVSFNTGGRYTPSADTWTPTSVGTSVPSPRHHHSAVWTGARMVVWGGDYGSNTGGRYNPAMDAWSPTTLTNAPQARSGHVAVWTGSLMVIWGGGPSVGGRYNPVSNFWQATSTVNAHACASAPSAVWTNTEMIAWGGIWCSTGARYNPVSDSWITMFPANAPIVRYAHTAVWAGDRMIIWGGYSYMDVNYSLDTGGVWIP